MAVFTSVELSALNDWAREHYGFRGVSALAPVSEGIENTNYRMTADNKDYIFTIFELWQDDAVDYYASLMRHLHAANLPVPAPISTVGGRYHLNWGDKPCLLVPFVNASWIETPAAAHCGMMGDMLAQMHIAAATFTDRRANPRGSDWRQTTARQIRQHLGADLQQLLDSVIKKDADFSSLPLPAAACHCDLFRNNVLWHDNKISAVIDFYFGGYDNLIFDLAVCACDWCYRDSAFDPQLLSALIRSYNQRRRLCDAEKFYFIDALNSAAARFWLSRHYDIIFPRQAQELTPHDPRYFEQILRIIDNNRDSLTQLMQEAA